MINKYKINIMFSELSINLTKELSKEVKKEFISHQKKRLKLLLKS